MPFIFSPDGSHTERRRRRLSTNRDGWSQHSGKGGILSFHKCRVHVCLLQCEQAYLNCINMD